MTHSSPAPLSSDLTESEARMVVSRIARGLTVVWDDVKTAYIGRAWLALGYQTWDELCAAEFGASQIRLPREERQEVVASLRDSGMSTRAIAAATGVDQRTVRREFATASAANAALANANVVGLNGRHYTPKATDADQSDIDPDEPIDAEIVDESETSEPVAEPKATAPDMTRQHRRPITDTARDAGWDIRKAAEKVQRLLADERFRKNEEQVALSLRGHLLFVAETVADAIHKLGNRKDTDV